MVLFLSSLLSSVGLGYLFFYQDGEAHGFFFFSSISIIAFFAFMYPNQSFLVYNITIRCPLHMYFSFVSPVLVKPMSHYITPCFELSPIININHLEVFLCTDIGHGGHRFVDYTQTALPIKPSKSQDIEIVARKNWY